MRNSISPHRLVLTPPSKRFQSKPAERSVTSPTPQVQSTAPLESFEPRSSVAPEPTPVTEPARVETPPQPRPGSDMQQMLDDVANPRGSTRVVVGSNGLLLMEVQDNMNPDLAHQQSQPARPFATRDKLAQKHHDQYMDLLTRPPEEPQDYWKSRTERVQELHQSVFGLLTANE